jgi:hypothetical protein
MIFCVRGSKSNLYLIYHYTRITMLDNAYGNIAMKINFSLFEY